MSPPVVIGEGSFGCVHRPALKCKDRDKVDDNKIVSKALSKLDASNELREFELISSADKKNNYHLGKPDSCYPDNTNSNKFALSQCKGKSFQKPQQLENYRLLLLKYGGKDLEQYRKIIQEMTINNANRIKVEECWMDMYNIICGIKVFHDKGVIHHDLKAQNIVYNPDNGKANFIDFGLMTTVRAILIQSQESNYDLAIKHWSFPMELEMLNKNKYMEIIDNTDSYFKGILKEFQTQHRYIFQCIFSGDKSPQVKAYFKDFLSMLKTLKKTDYNKVLLKSTKTIDSYGVGNGLLPLLYVSRKFLPEETFYSLKTLLLNMVHPNPFQRKTPDEIVNEYENILKSSGFLEKYNLKFSNYKLVENTSGNTPLLNKIDKISETNLHMSQPEIDTFIKSIVIKCPDEQELNPKTKRCNKKCKDGYSRNENFVCIKPTKERNSAKKSNSIKRCPAGKVLNPHTNRCNKTCKVGYHHNDKFVCVKTAPKSKNAKKSKSVKRCPAGKVLNPHTNRCNKTCKVGYHHNEKFVCVKK